MKNRNKVNTLEKTSILTNYWSNLILPIVCGLTSANMYYIQPLIPEASLSMGISYSTISMIYSMALIGNATALVFITPMGDFIDRKKIILGLYLMLFISLLLFYVMNNIYLLIGISFFIGVGASVIPTIISYLGTNKTSGITNIGKIMAGVLIGILLSRFFSSFLTTIWSWKTIYLFAAGFMLIAMLLIYFFLPNSKSSKTNTLSYSQMIISSISMLKSDPYIRLYSLSGFLTMAVFGSFWNNISIFLKHYFNFDQFEIGLFSILGFIGALTAMLSNRILKRLHSNNKFFFLLLALCFLLMAFGSDYFILLIILTLVFDGLIQLIHVGNQVQMYKKCKGNESRAASCYMILFVLGGAIGSKVSTSFYLYYDWIGLSLFCFVLSLSGYILQRFTRVICS